MYSENKSGPSVDSCGIPQVTDMKFDVVLTTEVN